MNWQKEMKLLVLSHEIPSPADSEKLPLNRLIPHLSTLIEQSLFISPSRAQFTRFSGLSTKPNKEDKHEVERTV
jgi:hypothetical protein